MSGGRDPDAAEGGAPPHLSVWHRFLLVMPRLKQNRQDGALGERLRSALVKPAAPGTAPKAPEKPKSIEELEDTVRFADDKERLVGLVGAPLAGLIGLLVIADLVTHDPAPLLKNGHVNKLHVSVSLYHELEVVLLVLAFLMLAMGWYRKRLYLGMVMALYGLTIFNLHYWGFGVPYVMAGAWLLVRAYRAQRDVRVATGDLPSRSGQSGQRRGGGGGGAGRPGPNKRYSPPTRSPRRPRPQKPENEQKAG
jgi:hypothetical protein